MRKSLWMLCFDIVKVISALVLIVGWIAHYFCGASVDAKIMAGSLVALAVGSLVYAAIKHVTLGRLSSYAQALGAINEGFSYVHEEHRLLRDNGTLQQRPLLRSRIKASCELFCDQIAEAFSLVTGTKCSACIKLLEDPEVEKEDGIDDYEIKTMCRDHGSKQRRNYPPQFTHSLGENTDFSELYANIENELGRHYFCTRLPFLNGYKNSSFKEIGGEPAVPNFLNWWPVKKFVRNWRWKLKYKSAIVTPISPLASENRTKESIVGYLCVDSPNLFAFRVHYDTELMAGCADGLYNLVTQYVDLTNDEDHEKKGKK